MHFLEDFRRWDCILLAFLGLGGRVCWLAEGSCKLKDPLLFMSSSWSLTWNTSRFMDEIMSSCSLTLSCAILICSYLRCWWIFWALFFLRVLTISLTSWVTSSNLFSSKPDLALGSPIFRCSLSNLNKFLSSELKELDSKVMVLFTSIYIIGFCKLNAASAVIGCLIEDVTRRRLFGLSIELLLSFVGEYSKVTTELPVSILCKGMLTLLWFWLGFCLLPAIMASFICSTFEALF